MLNRYLQMQQNETPAHSTRHRSGLLGGVWAGIGEKVEKEVI